MKKFIFNFKSNKIKKIKLPKNILGGKGANLSEMGRMGLPVPPGFTISTKVCEIFYKDKKKLNSKLISQINKEIKVIENAKDHRKFLLKTLDQAKKTIVIFSGWLTDYSVNEEFRNKIKNCLDRGVDIIIAWGYKKSGSISSEHKNAGEKAVRELQEWTASNKTKGTLDTFYFPNHSKILICDTKFAVMGSFNWLSNSGGSENEERSYIIYNRSFIEEELVEIMKNLYDPKKPLSRRQLMKNFVPFSRY